MFRTVLDVYRAAFSGLPRDVWIVSLVALVNRAGTMVLPFVALWLTQERGFPVSSAGVVLAAYGVGSIAGSWLGGWLSDRIGSTRTQVLSLLGSGVLFLLLGLSRGLPQIMAATVALAVVADAFRPAMMAEMAHRAPADRQARSFALLRLAVNLGMALGPAVGGFLALAGYFWLFVVDALTCWLAAGLLVVSLAPRPVRLPRFESEAGPLTSPWRDGPFLGLLLLVTGLTVVFFQVMSTVPVYYRTGYGFREDAIGLVLSFNALLVVVFEMVLIYAAENRRRMPLVGLGCALICLGFGIMPLGSSVGFVLLTVLIWSFGEMLTLPLLNVVVAHRAPPASRGRYMGLYMMAFAVGSVLAPLIGTAVYDRAGPDRLWLAVGLAGPVLWIAALWLDRRLEPEEGISAPATPAASSRSDRPRQ